jgi:hypothetical protein
VLTQSGFGEIEIVSIISNAAGRSRPATASKLHVVRRRKPGARWHMFENRLAALMN